MSEEDDIFASFAQTKTKTSVQTNPARRQPSNSNAARIDYGDLEDILEINPKKKSVDEEFFEAPPQKKSTSTLSYLNKDTKKGQKKNDQDKNEVDDVEDILGDILGDQKRPQTQQNPNTRDLGGKQQSGKNEFFEDIDNNNNNDQIFSKTDQNFNVSAKFGGKPSTAEINEDKKKLRDNLFGISRPQTATNDQQQQQQQQQPLNNLQLQRLRGQLDDDPHNYSAFDVNPQMQGTADFRSNQHLDYSAMELQNNNNAVGGQGQGGGQVGEFSDNFQTVSRRRQSLKKMQSNTPNRGGGEAEPNLNMDNSTNILSSNNNPQKRPGTAPVFEKTQSSNVLDERQGQPTTSLFSQRQVTQQQQQQQPFINIGVADSEQNSEKDQQQTPQSISRRSKKTLSQMNKQGTTTTTQQQQPQQAQQQQQQYANTTSRRPPLAQQQQQMKGTDHNQLVQSDEFFPDQNRDQLMGQQHFRKETQQFDISEKDNSITQSNFQNFGDGLGPIMTSAQNQPLIMQQQISSQNQIQRNILPSTEDKYKQILKEREEQFKQSFESQKKQYEDQIKLIQSSCEQQIKKERELHDQIIETLNNERKRYMENHENELRNRENMYNENLKNQKYQLEQESLKEKTQLQLKMGELANELQTNSEKLRLVTQRLDQQSMNNQQQNSSHNQELSIQQQSSMFQEQQIKLNKRERDLQELQDRLTTELANIQREKERLDRQRSELDLRQIEFSKDLEKQKLDLHNEYVRLQEFQDTLKNQDHERRRALIAERTLLEEERSQLEEEKIKLKEDYEQKYRSLFEQEQTYENVKRSQKEFLDKQSQQIREKLFEVDEIKKRITLQEFNSLKKLKIIEEKEMEVLRLEDENKRGQQKLQMEQYELQREIAKFQDQVSKVQQDNSEIERFRQTFEQEKRRIVDKESLVKEREKRLEQELIKHDKDKNELKMMEQTLQGLKQEYVSSLAFENYRKAKMQSTSQQGFRDIDNNNQTNTGQFGRTADEGYFGKFTIQNQQQQYEDEQQSAQYFMQQQQQQMQFNKKKPETPNKSTMQQFNLRQSNGFAVNNNNSRASTNNKQEGFEKNQNNDIKNKDQFNYNNFMQNLQNYSNLSNQNNDYIVKERERILQAKITQNQGGDKLY